MSAIHERANAYSLGLLRLIVFLIWAIIPIWEQAPRIATLPLSTFSLPGFLGALPTSAQNMLLSDIGIWLVILATIAMSLSVAIGVYPRRWFSIATVIVIIIYEGIVRGLSGHINHAELALLYVTIALLVFPIYDGLAIRANSNTVKRRPEHYRSAFIVAMLIFTLSFSLVGAARLSEGIGIFGGDTLANIMLGRHASSVGSITEANLILPWYMRPEYLFVPRLGYALTTVAELASPLALLYRTTRIGFVAFALFFHIVNWIWLGVTFFENLVLLVIFSERWFHKVAAWLGRKQSWAART